MSPLLRPTFDFNDLFYPRALGAITLVALVGGALGYSAGSRYGLLVGILAGVLAAAVAVAFAVGLLITLPSAAANGLATVMTASGGSTPLPEDWSYEKSLIARGEVEKALEALRARLGAAPDDVQLCLFLADVYVRDAHQPATAEPLYLRAREMRAAKPADDYRATNRLLDLYMGPLDDPSRAAAELMRLRDRHPGTAAGRHAVAALQRLPPRVRHGGG